MNFIDRYVAEVGRHLPEKDRADIEAEIRSMIEDMLAERSQETGKPVDDKLIPEVLEELGDPRLLASKYAPPKRYLIGPGWYDVYVISLQRVLFTALPIFAAVTFIVSLTRDPLDFMNAAGQTAGGVFNVGLQIWFWMTLAFIFIERSDIKPDESHRSTTRAWTVAQLPKLPKERQISIAESVMNIATVLLVIIWVALPPILDRFQGGSGSVPLLHPGLWNFWLPLLFVIMGLTLVYEAFQLKIGNWTPALTAMHVILNLISIIYIAALVITQEVINPAFLAGLGDSGEMAKLREVATWSIDISAAIIAGIYAWDIVNSIRLAKQHGKQKSEFTAPMQNLL